MYCAQKKYKAGDPTHSSPEDRYDKRYVNASDSVIIIMETSLLGVVGSVSDIAVVVIWAFLLLARSQHALEGNAHRCDTQYGAPLGSEDRRADMSIGIHMGMDWRLVLVVHDELDSRRGDGILAVEADLEDKDLALVEALSEDLDGK